MRRALDAGALGPVDAPARVAFATLLDRLAARGALTEADVDALCARALTPFGPVAAVCVWPRFVARARGAVADGVAVAAVANGPRNPRRATAAGAHAAAKTAAGSGGGALTTCADGLPQAASRASPASGEN